MSTGRLKIGQLLVKQGTLSPEAVDQALLLQRATSAAWRPLASQLLDAGLISSTDALRALSEQFGVPGIDLRQVAILTAHLEHVPQAVAIGRRLLPVLAREDRIFLAMSNPKDRRAIDELESLTGRKVFPYVAVLGALEKATMDAYATRERGETYYLAPDVPEQTLVQLGLRKAPDKAGPRPSHSAAPAVGAPDGGPAPEPETAPAPALAMADILARTTGATKESRLMSAVDTATTQTTVQAPRNVVAAPDENARKTVRPREVAALGPSGYAEVLDKVARDRVDQGDPIAEDAADLDRPPQQHGRSLGAAAMLTSPTFAAAPEVTGRLVMVVDDEDGIRKLLRRMLKSMGHRVVEARGGREALELLREHTAELVLMDAMLPELHGFDVARRMRASQKYRDVPIIMMSGVYKGWGVAQELEESYRIHDYVEKPFDVRVMTELLARHLTRLPGTAGEQRDEPRDAQGPRGAGDARAAANAEAEALLVAGVEAYKAGDMDAAVSALRRGIDKDPESYRLRFQLALLYGKRGQIYDGIRELELAVELAPGQFQALKNLAILYEKAGEKGKARDVWQRCVDAAPDPETGTSIREHLMKLA